MRRKRRNHPALFKTKVAVAAVREGLGRYFGFYNTERHHQGLGVFSNTKMSLKGER